MFKLVLGVLLVLGALAAMVRVLGEQIPGYFQDADRIEQQIAETDALLAKAEKGTAAEKEEAARQAQSDTESIRRQKDFQAERLQGIGIVGVGGTIALLVGILLIRSWRRGRPRLA